MAEVGHKSCVGCGYCCIKRWCFLADHVFAFLKAGRGSWDEPRCPALEWRLNRYYCRLALTPGPIGTVIRLELAIGSGCSSGLNSWRREVKRQ